MTGTPSIQNPDQEAAVEEEIEAGVDIGIAYVRGKGTAIGTAIEIGTAKEKETETETADATLNLTHRQAGMECTNPSIFLVETL